MFPFMESILWICSIVGLGSSDKLLWNGSGRGHLLSLDSDVSLSDSLLMAIQSLLIILVNLEKSLLSQNYVTQSDSSYFFTIIHNVSL